MAQGWSSTIGGSSSLVEGDAESRRIAREDFRRGQRLAAAEASRLPRLDLADLTYLRFGVVEHAGGARYRISRGESVDLAFSNITAWYLTNAGEPVFLEPAK